MNVFQDGTVREMDPLSEESARPPRSTIVFSQDVATVRGQERFDEILAVSQSRATRDIGIRRKSDFKDASTTEFHLLSPNDAQYSSGKRYTDHLTSQTAIWLFFPMGKKEKLERAPSILPRHRLQRVLERMRDLRGDLDLETLATESGYSRSHFLRMFRASTGCTPHRYLLQLRLERAKELMRQKSMSLIDIAATCGFSSHAHLSKMFRQIVGMPPSEYRRNLSCLTPPALTYLEGSR